MLKAGGPHHAAPVLVTTVNETTAHAITALGPGTTAPALTTEPSPLAAADGLHRHGPGGL
jgi:hypothetical protein